MIKKIGFKRAVILFSLFGVMAALAAASFLLFRPQAEASMAELNRITGETSTLQGEIEKMKSDFSVFQKEKALYDRINNVGFFGNQDRVVAREKFNAIQRLAKVISVQYEIKSATILNNAEGGEESEYVVMESPITIKLSAIDDIDIYRFIYFLNYGFAGHITIDNFEIERTVTVDDKVLRQIGVGDPPPILTAKMDLRWRTMAKKDTIAPEDLAVQGTAVLQ